MDNFFQFLLTLSGEQIRFRMSNSNYHLDLYKVKTKRLRNLTILFLSLFGIALTNFWSHQFDYDEYYGNLKNILYDFSQEYDEVLVNWCNLNYDSESKIENRYIIKFPSDTYIIEFENEERLDNHIVWDSIPQLKPYLEKHAPKRKRYSTLFSWELPYHIFIFVAFIMPLVLLIMIAIDIHGLYKIKRIVSDKMNPEGDVNLILHSVFYSRIKLSDKEFYLVKGIFIGIFYFITATLTSFLFLAATRFATRYIAGELYVGSPTEPNFELGNVIFDLSYQLNISLLIIILVYLFISFIIGLQYKRLMKN